MIRDENLDGGANIGIDKLAFPYIVSGKHTDGSLPKVIWVAKGGADAAGATGVSHVGTRKDPFLTIGGANGALRYTVDGRGDRIILGPGTWRENLDFGSGTGTTGTAGRMNKRDIGIYGSGGAHPGRTQIVGDGTTTGPTLRVRDGYLRGFILSDLEVGAVTTGDADRAVPGIDLETNDTAALTATSSDEWAVLRNVDIFSDTTGTAGLILTGATMVKAYNLHISGWIAGIMFRGSANNNPDNCLFYGVEFADNLTMDIGATNLVAVGVYPGTWTMGTLSATNVRFYRAMHMDRGGTPVTNYINWGGGTGTGTTVNCGEWDSYWARDIADGTLVQIPADFVCQGYSAAGAEFVIGA